MTPDPSLTVTPAPGVERWVTFRSSPSVTPSAPRARSRTRRRNCCAEWVAPLVRMGWGNRLMVGASQGDVGVAPGEAHAGGVGVVEGRPPHLGLARRQGEQVDAAARGEVGGGVSAVLPGDGAVAGPGVDVYPLAGRQVQGGQGEGAAG